MLSPRVALVAAFLLFIPVDASQGRICLDACTCRLTFTNNTARLYARCDDVIEFPSVHDANSSLILLVAGAGKDLTELDDFTCDSCKIDDIDRDAFEGVADVDAATLADGLLVQVPTDALEGDNGVVVQMVKHDIDDCVAFIRKFAGLRPAVDVEECDADDVDPMLANSYEDYDNVRPRRRNSVGKEDADDAGTTPAVSDGNTTETPMRRNDAGDVVVEDVEGKVDGVMPLVPDEDPATVFAPWTIAVIAVVGAIIVGVAGYYIWQKWTEIRSCCCGGEYSQP